MGHGRRFCQKAFRPRNLYSLGTTKPTASAISGFSAPKSRILVGWITPVRELFISRIKADGTFEQLHNHYSALGTFERLLSIKNWLYSVVLDVAKVEDASAFPWLSSTGLNPVVVGGRWEEHESEVIKQAPWLSI